MLFYFLEKKKEFYAKEKIVLGLDLECFEIWTITN